MPLTFLSHTRQKPLPGVLKLDIGHPLSVGLSDAWLLNESSSSSLNDYGTNGKSLTFQDAPSWSSGLGGPSLLFNGTSNYVSQGSGITLGADLFGTVDSSMELWVNNLSNTGQYRGIVTQGRDNGTGGSWWGVWMDGSNRWAFGIRAAGVSGDIFQSTSAATGIHHLVVTYNATSKATALYVDAVLAASGTAAGSLGNSAEFVVGRALSVGEYWNGHVLGVKIWRRLLTATDAANLYAAPYAMWQTRPLQRWFTVVAASGGIPPGLGPVVQMQQEFHLDSALMR